MGLWVKLECWSVRIYISERVCTGEKTAGRVWNREAEVLLMFLLINYYLKMRTKTSASQTNEVAHTRTRTQMPPESWRTQGKWKIKAITLSDIIILSDLTLQITFRYKTLKLFSPKQLPMQKNWKTKHYITLTQSWCAVAISERSDREKWNDWDVHMHLFCYISSQYSSFELASGLVHQLAGYHVQSNGQ